MTRPREIRKKGKSGTTVKPIINVSFGFSAQGLPSARVSCVWGGASQLGDQLMARIFAAALACLMCALSADAQTTDQPTELPPPTRLETPQDAAPVIMPVAGGLPVDDWRFWVNADYGIAWVQGKRLPPLATTSPVGTPQGAAGVLGAEGTRIVLGDEPISEDARSLGRLGLGVWLNPERTLGADASLFIAQGQDASFRASSDGTTILARPFIEAGTELPTSILVGFPGATAGDISVAGSMETFWGAGVGLRELVVLESWFRLESLFGYRYLHYGEQLSVRQNLTSIGVGGAFVPGTTIATNDRFNTENDFHGVDFGFRTEIFGERWSVELLTKLAGGRVSRDITIAGDTRTTVPGADPVNNVGGALALASNIGSRSNANWVLAPELGLTLGYSVTDNMRVRLGYSFLLLQDVARAGDQVDLTLNQNLFPPAVLPLAGPARPAFFDAKSDIWLQSINLGVELRF